MSIHDQHKWGTQITFFTGNGQVEKLFLNIINEKNRAKLFYVAQQRQTVIGVE